jgi:N-acetylglucosaminyldiphosphoundecaprenol N-acetyl-beta-D-mannosaminyltransferase
MSFPEMALQEELSLSTHERIAEQFSRDVHCLFGLPVDNLTMASAMELIREKVKKRDSHVLSTVNVNWVAQSLRDRDFRDVIIGSDIVTIDGRPLLWLAQSLGLPMREVVAGSTLLYAFREDLSGRPLTVYLFGGEDGVAELAMARVNAEKAGIRIAGFCFPGFGTVKEMSTKEIIDSINAADPDFLLVALGARKGTRWIEQNRGQLKVGVISHLGATINFLAGSIKRAPRWMQGLGLEWVWRILQEPKLFSRYFSDGLTLSAVLLKTFPYWLGYLGWRRNFTGHSDRHIGNKQEGAGITRITFGNYPHAGINSLLREWFCESSRSTNELILDFQTTHHVDDAFLGLFVLLKAYMQKNGRTIAVVNRRERLKNIFGVFGVRNLQAGVEE